MLCIAEETISREEVRQAMSWEKIFENHTSDKGLIFKICKELTFLNSRGKNSLIKKQAEGTEYTFLKSASRYMRGQGPEKCKLTTETHRLLPADSFFCYAKHFTFWVCLGFDFGFVTKHFQSFVLVFINDA